MFEDLSLIMTASETCDEIRMAPVQKLVGRKSKTQRLAIFDAQSLIKYVKSLQNKKISYTARLKKAYKLSESRIFQRSLKQLSSLASISTVTPMNKNIKQQKFTDLEKIKALNLYKHDSIAYKWLQKLFILPSSMSLKRLIAKVKIKPGYNAYLLAQLKKRSQAVKRNDKLCILLFDEIAITPYLYYNQSRDEISGFVDNGKSRQAKSANNVLVFMIRGVKQNFKQPIAYTFSSGNTNPAELAILIKEVIEKLHSVGLHVIATVCDQQKNNVSAINALIDETKRKYLHRNEELSLDIFEVENREIIPLFDPPNLIKSIRNNLLKRDLICTIKGCTLTAKWEHIVKLFEENLGWKGMKLIPKLTDIHVKPTKLQKLKVKYATQVFSQRVGSVMGYLAESNLLPLEFTHTAQVILFLDELFDSLNGSSTKSGPKRVLSPVTPLSRHHAVWEKAKIILSTMKFVNSKKPQDKHITVPTIKNLLHTINNVKYMLWKLYKEYKIKVVKMRYFNQDPLENFLGTIRSHRTRSMNPTAVGFESSYASLLINDSSDQHSSRSNCEADGCRTMFKAKNFLFQHLESVPIHTISGDYNDIVYINLEDKINDPRKLATLQFFVSYFFKKAMLNIFGGCVKCKGCLLDNNNINGCFKLREYRNGKIYVTYPNNNIVILLSKIQDLSTYFITNHCTAPNIKTHLKSFLYRELDFGIVDCKNHKSEIIEYLLELSSKFYLCNWCRDINNRRRLNLDNNE